MKKNDESHDFIFYHTHSNMSYYTAKQMVDVFYNKVRDIYAEYCTEDYDEDAHYLRIGMLSILFSSDSKIISLIKKDHRWSKSEKWYESIMTNLMIVQEIKYFITS